VKLRRREGDRATAGPLAALASRPRIALLGALLLAVLVIGSVLWLSGGDEPPPTRIGYVGKDLVGLELDKQVREKSRYWERYADRDAPEGAYLGWMLPGASSLPARVPLRRTLQPGKYYVFLKAITYERPIKVKLSVGGGEAIVKSDDADDNRYWSDGVAIKVKSATKQLRLSLLRSGKPTEKEKLLLRGLYLTSDPHEVVLASDRVVALDYPEAMDEGSPRRGNIVENGSFETGLGHGWGSTDDRRFSLDSVWDPKTGKDGGASLKLPLDPAQSGTGPIEGKSVAVVSKAYSVAPNKRHTLSAWLKTEPGAPVTGRIDLLNSFGRPIAPRVPGRRGQHFLSREFRAGGGWTRVDLTGFLLRYPTADYHVRISADVAAGRHLWVDAVSLNEGGPVPYAPKAPLEIGLQRTRPSNLYYEDEPVRMRLRAYNAGARALKRTVRYEIYDYLNRRVRASSRKVHVPAASVTTGDLGLPVGRRGIFRIVTWVQGEEGSEEEVIFGVVPRPRRPGADGASLIGTHSNFTDFGYDAMARLGIKWDRALSPALFFRWADAEPEDDRFVWFDSETRRAQRRGISVLGTLGTNNEWPQWADDDGLPDLAKWQEYVGQVVRHYRGRVKAWEIWNEPNSQFEPAFYAQMLKRGAEAVKRADPAASVVAMGGPDDPQFVRDVFDELRKQYPSWPRRRYIDDLSMHMYPARGAKEAADGGAAGAYRERILPRYGLPVWNTETGEWDTGFFRTSNAVRAPWGTSLFEFADAAELTASSPFAINSVTRTFLETIGSGLRKIFYYDFRVGATPTYPQSAPTMLEYDDTVRPKGIAYAVLAHLFDRSRGLGRIRLADAQSQAFLFDRGGVPLVGLYALDDRLRAIRPAGLSTGRLKVYDSMGNRISITGGRIPYGPTPVYIEGRGVAVRAVERALRRGAVSERADTRAPALTVDQAPRGPIDSSSVRVRWSATDEAAVPSFARPDAISYSYRLVGAGRAKAWSGWTQRSLADYTDLSEGRYRLEVRARDAAGNQSAVVSRSIEVR